MKNFKLEKLNQRSINCAEFITPAKYIAKNFVVDANNTPMTGVKLDQHTRYVAEYMKMGADLVKGKYWWSGLIIGVTGTLLLSTYLALQDEKNSEKEEEA